jgi:multidrug resistance efflux pump
MKKAIWVTVAVGLAVAGAWGYSALVREENDRGQPLRLLAIAEEQGLALSFSRSGRLVTRVPDEGEEVKAGDIVAGIEEPGLSFDAADFERQRGEVQARERTRLEEVSRLKAEFAEIQSEERRLSRLVREGIAPAAELESLRHRRDAVAAGIRAREAEKGELEAESQTLSVRAEKVRRFEQEGTLAAPAAGRVLTRHHRQGEWVEAGDPIVTLQIEEPYLRAEVPEERLSTFIVGSRVVAWPQARPDARFRARVVSIKPRSEFATRKNWGLQDRDLKTFSVRLAPEGRQVVAGQTFVLESGRAH